MEDWMTLTRRNVVFGGTALAALGAAALWIRPATSAYAAEGARPAAEAGFQFTEEEWASRLSEEEFYILRQAGTERAFTSPLNDEHRTGIFNCAGCELPVFESETKFDSGTGWPSFYQPVAGNVSTMPDYSYGMNRTECHCRRCGGHLGHVFNDGPPPTGERWCINGDGLHFVPA
jgi:peptide-methionine (R)-S-oxide reductase